MKHLLTALLAITMPAFATPVTETNNPFDTISKNPTAPVTPTKTVKKTAKKKLPTTAQPTGLNCGSLPRTCYAMTTCAQAQAAYKCGNTKLDRDKDGIPCDKLCQ